MEILLREDFEPHLNQPFTIRRPSGGVKAQLVEVTPLGKPSRPSAGVREPFSLLFQADSNYGMLDQGLYSVSNPSLGVKTLFLVPVGRKENHYQYEAIFN